MRPARLLAAAITAAVISAAALLSPAPAQAAGLCIEERGALISVNARIDVHNARRRVFTLPREAGLLAAYNAEANALNAEARTARSALVACLRAEARLTGVGGPTSFRIQAPPRRLAGIDTARRRLPPGYRPAPVRPSTAGAQVPARMRPLYDRLRSGNPPRDFPDVPLHGRPRPRVGDPDPAVPGATIPANTRGNPAVSPDHIVPLSELITLPGFTRLTARNMYAVTRAPANLQWLPTRLNMIKKSRSMSAVTGLDPAFVRAQVHLERRVRRELVRAIQDLLRMQGAGPR